MWYRVWIVFLSCVFVVSADLYVRKAPRWASELPGDTCFIYGVGVATIEGNVAEARKKAEQYALVKIAQVLKSVVVGTVQSRTGAMLKGNSLLTLSDYDEAISVFAEATLTDCQIVEAAIVKKDDTYWVLAAMNRELYDKKINAHFYNSIKIAQGALEASYAKGSEEGGVFLSKLHRLEQGLDAVEQFWGVPMYSVVQGRKVLLNIALVKRIEELFSQLQLKSTATGVVTVGKRGELPDAVGVQLLWNGLPVEGVSLLWQADKSVKLDEGVVVGGLARPQIRGINARDGVVTLKAEVDLNRIVWRLRRRGVVVVLPSSACLAVRGGPKEVCVVFGSPTRDFVNWLTEHGEAVLSADGYGLELSLIQEPARLSRGMYHVRSEAVLKIQGEGSRIEHAVVTAMGRSGADAMRRSREELYRKLAHLL